MQDQQSGTSEWLGGDEHRTWAVFYGVVLQLPAALQEHLQKSSGFSLMEYSVLFTLMRTPDRTARLSEIATAINCEISRLSHLISRLEMQGLLVRAADPSNGRFRQAALTKKGEAEFLAATPPHIEEIRRLVFAPLSTEEQHELRRILAKIALTLHN